ncbi:MAG: hypothetical protein WA063_02110, partial [Minisyncoccia bacterium]
MEKGLNKNENLAEKDTKIIEKEESSPETFLEKKMNAAKEVALNLFNRGKEIMSYLKSNRDSLTREEEEAFDKEEKGIEDQAEATQKGYEKEMAGIVGGSEIEDNKENNNAQDNEGNKAGQENYNYEKEKGKIRDLVDEMKIKVKKKAEELGLSEKDVIEMTGLEENIFEQLDSPEKFTNKSGNLVEKLANFNDMDIESYRKFFNENVGQINLEKDPSRIIEFIKKNHCVIKASCLFLYFVNIPSSVAEDLIGSEVQVDVNGTEVPISQFIQNPDVLNAEDDSENDHKFENAEKEVVSKEMNDLYDKVENLPDNKVKYDKLDDVKEETDLYLDYAESIHNGEKESVNQMVDDLVKSSPRVITFGEWHGPESNAINTVEILEKFKEKGGEEIGSIVFEFLSYTDPEAVKLTEQFNNKEISVKEFYNSGHLYARSDIRPILEFAQQNDIPIAGLEKEKVDFAPDDFNRFTEISHRVGEIANENKNKVEVVFVGVRHLDEETFELPDAHIGYREAKADANEKDYIINKYLEEDLGLKTAEVKFHVPEIFAIATDEFSREKYINLGEEDKKEFAEHVEVGWKNYESEQEETVVVKHKEGVYSVVSPGKIADVPTYVNALESIRENYPQLEETMHKLGVFVSYGYDKITLQYNNENLVVAEIDHETGKLKEILLTSDDYNKNNKAEPEDFDNFAIKEKLREIRAQY